MGHPAQRAEEVSDVGAEPEESVTGVGVPNVLLATCRELERGDVLGARYQIEAIIGTGGSGRVLRAFDREARTPVALKILRPEFAADPVWAERFSRELRIGRSIIHPNVCRVFDIGDADGHKFLSMELASRGSIRAEVPKVGATRMTPTRPQRAWAERVADAQAVVAGVAALHAAGIVHRDIKPENILRMEDGRLVVTDFGLATDPGANAGNTVMVGTPSYMAPEVVMGEPATARSDVWGLGIVLHEILFACRPQWKAIGRGYRRFVQPDDIATAAQRAAADLCGRCADDAADIRPASAVEVASELERALRGKRRWTRPRGRQVVWGALALASFATLGLIRERWSNRAQASLSSAAAPLGERVLTLTGNPEDWSKGSMKVASFAGRLHCSSVIDGGKSVRAIWGMPRKAEDIDIETGQRSPSNLLPETYRDGCPTSSPDGKSLLFERATAKGSHVYLSRYPDGRESVEIVRGALPAWLPNGKEFVFGFDGKNAGLFSIPTGEMVLVPADPMNTARHLLELAVDPDGSHLVVLYYDERLQKLLLTYDLPSLTLSHRILMPSATHLVRFDPTGKLTFAAKGTAGDELIAADIRNGLGRHLAVSPGNDVLGMLSASGRTLIAKREARDDLWLGDRHPGERLTSDGVSLSGAISREGLLLSQKRLPDGKLAIFLRSAGGSESQVTSGPLDVTPAFYPDGTRWLYANLSTKQIVSCDVTKGQCNQVWSDSLVPGFPSVDPTGHRMAYVTFNNASRLRVASLDDTRPLKDLGPAAGMCAPVWVNDDRLWFVQSLDGTEMTWSEMSVNTAVASGQSEKVRVANQFDCHLPKAAQSAIAADRLRGYQQVVSFSDEISDLMVK